jgi:GNAT superfamily N-acetyltransferase
MGGEVTRLARALRGTVVPSDVEAVRRLVAVTGFFSPPEVEIAAELVQETLADPARGDYRFLFADGAPGDLAGYSCFGPIPLTEGSWDVYWIAVDPARQGHGLGRSLLHESERRAQAAGATRFFIDTSGRAQYDSTHAFYERCGYSVGARLGDFYGPGDSKVIYQRRLAPPPPAAQRTAGPRSAR